MPVSITSTLTRLPRRRQPTSTAPPGVLDGVGDEVLDDAGDQRPVGQRHRRAVDEGQPDGFFPGRGGEFDGDLLRQVAQPEGRRLRLERSRVDARHVEQGRHDFFHSI
jgi:hypothetical protein